jgi:DNA N-6-adenine-methyltransferase (Dam)
VKNKRSTKVHKLPARIRKSTGVAKFDPEKSLKKIADLKTGEEKARRARDTEGMKKAIVKKMREQGAYIIWRYAAMAAARKTWSGPGRGKKGPQKNLSVLRASLPKADPGEKTAHRWRKDLCSEVQKEIDGKIVTELVLDEKKVARAIEDAHHRSIRACERSPTGTERGTAGTGEFERYTPAEYVEAVRAVLGEIDLDPASNATAQRTVKAKEFFNQKKNGLKQEWNGRIFLNPPYHRELAPLFIDKLVEEVDAGRTTAAILLTNNSTDSDWFRKAQIHCAAICFTHGRIKFTTPDQKEVLPTQGQCFFFFGQDVDRFINTFCAIGWGCRSSGIWSHVAEQDASFVSADQPTQAEHAEAAE